MIKTQENLNVMRKLLFDLKKKIQDSCFYYFYHIGSQKLGEKHLATITKWQAKLESASGRKPVKRLSTNNNSKSTNPNDDENCNKENDKTITIENIPFDCKLEIMRRLNSGLDLVNLSKCSSSLNGIINKELTMWKDLCRFHFQQAHINSLVNQPLHLKLKSKPPAFSTNKQDEHINELDWKSMYFKLKKRYGHREVYANMIHKCFHCKCLFWKVNSNILTRFFFNKYNLFK